MIWILSPFILEEGRYPFGGYVDSDNDDDEDFISLSWKKGRDTLGSGCALLTVLTDAMRFVKMITMTMSMNMIMMKMEMMHMTTQLFS